MAGSQIGAGLGTAPPASPFCANGAVVLAAVQDATRRYAVACGPP